MTTFLPAGHPLRFHPFAEMFPLMNEGERAELGAHIKAHGQQQPVWLHRGLILDGRNRYLACARLGIGVRAQVFSGPDRAALDFVVGANLQRRHLDETQRAVVAASIARLPVGANQHTLAAAAERAAPVEGASIEAPSAPPVIDMAPVPQAEAAAMLNVSRSTVQRVAKVEQQGVPGLKEAMAAGQLRASAAAEIAALPLDEQQLALERRGIVPPINGERALMASRREPDEGADYFPTPPFATRALIERVLPSLGIAPRAIGRAWEPACGEGHMAGVLEEYPLSVIATDKFDYCCEGRMPPAWWRMLDFLDAAETVPAVDWIITNPPFKDGADFVQRALKLAAVGVAVFMRVQWLETIDRYEKIFKDTPPTLIAFFVERVPLCKGKWNPEGGTATAYMWLVWIKDFAPIAPLWIPPGCRKELTRPDDVERFTAHPVRPPNKQERASETASAGPPALIDSRRESGDDVCTPEAPAGPAAEAAEGPLPAAGPANDDDGLALPDFLRRRAAP